MDCISTYNDMVLRHGSALELLELFVGYLSYSKKYVYSLKAINNPDINEIVLENFEEIEVVEIDGLYCTSLNQTINDMLEDDMSDLQALLEALSNYFYNNQKSFDGLKIKDYNQERFKEIKQWAVDYYTG